MTELFNIVVNGPGEFRFKSDIRDELVLSYEGTLKNEGITLKGKSLDVTLKILKMCQTSKKLLITVKKDGVTLIQGNTDDCVDRFWDENPTEFKWALGEKYFNSGMGRIVTMMYGRYENFGDLMTEMEKRIEELKNVNDDEYMFIEFKGKNMAKTCLNENHEPVMKLIKE